MRIPFHFGRITGISSTSKGYLSRYSTRRATKMGSSRHVLDLRKRGMDLFGTSRDPMAGFRTRGRIF